LLEAGTPTGGATALGESNVPDGYAVVGIDSFL